MKAKAFLPLFFLLPLLCSAQFNYYPYYTADTTGFTHLADSCSKKIVASFIVPQDVNSKYKKDYNSARDDSKDYVRSLVRYTSITDTLIYPFLQSVYKKIVAGNPALAGYSIVLSDWPIMNAANVGGHVVVVYAPLLSRLQNESQVASVLCHELAHGELDHIQKKIKKSLDEYYSESFQKELKKTLSEEFNVQSKLNLLALKYSFSSRFHDRSQEKAADSLGYVFMTKTDYDSREFVAVLSILKEIDKPVYKDSVDYASMFKCSSYPFDFTSVSPYHKTSIFGATDENKAHNDSLGDSLKTHPDCEKRIAYINDLMKAVPAKAGKNTDAALFAKVQWAAAMEMIYGYFNYEYYDYSLYYAVLYLKHNRDNDFLKAIVLLSWYEMYDAMKQHNLADYISNYSDDAMQQFNDLLYMINEMRLPNLTDICHCFAQNNKITEKEFALAIDCCMAKLNGDSGSSMLEEKYKTEYKNGRFAKILGLYAKTKKKK